MRLGRNVKINEGVRPSDFKGRRTISSGGTVDSAPARRKPARARACQERRRRADCRAHVGLRSWRRPLTASTAAVDAWLAELGLKPVERAEREGATSWDLILDGRRRRGLRLTLILDPAVALIAWVHFAPPMSDNFRKSYRQLLRWNDELPFAKFALSEDERPVLTAEVSAVWAGARRGRLVWSRACWPSATWSTSPR